MKRYPLEPLFAAMRATPNTACAFLGLSGTTQQQYRRDGVTERVADRLAVKAGLMAYEVWPEMIDDAIATIERDCARHDCTQLFVPSRADQRYCTPRCAVLTRQRRYRTDPRGAEAARRSAARYYAENGDYVRGQRRRRYQQEQAS